MALDQSALLEIVEMMRSADDGELMRRLLGTMMQALVDAEATEFIGVVSQPGMVFGFDPETGYTGLLTGKKAAVSYTSVVVYGSGRPPSFGEDFQAPYLTSWLRWTGIEDISTVEFRPNLATGDADSDRERAHTDARDLGKRF